MQRKYLGDAKDCFKWDYLGYLMQAFGYGQLQIVWMMNPDNDDSSGFEPSDQPWDQRVVALCRELRKTHDPKLLTDLPRTVGASFEVSQYGAHEHMSDRDRASYFEGISTAPLQCFFLDPDTGFEPKKSTNRHVRYDEVQGLLKRAAPGSPVTVFQSFRYVPFVDDFAAIAGHFDGWECSAVYSDHPNYSIMLVSITSDPETTVRLREANTAYAKRRRGVKALPADQSPPQGASGEVPPKPEGPPSDSPSDRLRWHLQEAWKASHDWIDERRGRTRRS